MLEGRIIARLRDKNTGKLKEEIVIKNQIADTIYSMWFSSTRNVSTLSVSVGYDELDTIAANNPKVIWTDVSGFISETISVAATDMGYQSYEYRCIAPDSAFAPADRSINLIALSHSNGPTLYAYKKLATPIVQTNADDLELIYALSIIMG